jgi:hypothetical protein
MTFDQVTVLLGIPTIALIVVVIFMCGKSRCRNYE